MNSRIAFGVFTLMFVGSIVCLAGMAQAMPAIENPENCKGGVPDGAFRCLDNVAAWVMCTPDGDYMCCVYNNHGGKDCELIESLRRPPGLLRPPMGGEMLPPPSSDPGSRTRPVAPHPRAVEQ
jgi:hypothetical protein